MGEARGRWKYFAAGALGALGQMLVEYLLRRLGHR